MVLRWIHKGWKLFWTVVLSTLLVIVVIGGGALVFLQLDATEDIIAEKIENDFRQNYKGVLSIGELDGVLPFNAEFKRVVLTSDTSRADTLLNIAKVSIGVDVWSIFQNKLSINAFKLQEPNVMLQPDGAGSYTLSQALQSEQEETQQSSVGQFTSSWIRNIEIIAPHVAIVDGSLFVESFYGNPSAMNLPEPLSIDALNAQMFIELTNSQRLIDIETFNARLNGHQSRDLSLSGQVYNDSQLLEFNAFHIAVDNSQLLINGIIEGIDLYAGAVDKQLEQATYDIDINSDQIILGAFSDLFTGVPPLEKSLGFTVQLQGTLNVLRLQTFKVGVGDSYVGIQGQLSGLLNQSQLDYDFTIDTLAVQKDDITLAAKSLNLDHYIAFDSLMLDGEIDGNSDSLRLALTGQSPLGSFSLRGRRQLTEPYAYRARLLADSVDVGPFVAGVDTTVLNVKAAVYGQNTSLKTGTMQFELSAQNSAVDHIGIDSLHLAASIDTGLAEASYYYRQGQQYVQGHGAANFNPADPAITLKGNTQQLNIASLFSQAPVDSTSLNASYTIDIQGLKADRIQGDMQIEVTQATINGDSVGTHQLQAHLDAPSQGSRTLEVNSSLFDLTVNGNLKPTNLANQFTYWSNYFKGRLSEEILLDSTNYVPPMQPSVTPTQLQGQLQIKNLALAKQYWPAFPKVVTDTRIQFEAAADSVDLRFLAQLQSDTVKVNQVELKEAALQLEGRFQHNKKLKEYSHLKIRARAPQLKSNLLKMDSVNIKLDYQQDSLYYAQNVGQFSDNARFNLQLHSILSDNGVKVVVDNLFLGNNSYAWQEEDKPAFVYKSGNRIAFNAFQFTNNEELFALEGVLSPSPSDSLQYVIRHVDLGRISDLLTSEINFDGSLNGTFTTSSLTKEPSIVGELAINRFQLQDRLVGDALFSSTYNVDKEQFDIALEVLTDSTKYNKYVQSNNNIGQNIVLKGYFDTSKMGSAQDSTFYFDAHFNEIDMWVIQLITDNIFSDIEGRASGNGYITGSLQNIDYHADFQVDDVYAKPKFLESNFHLTGHVIFDRQEGVVLDEITVRDERGGSGLLTGTVDLNEFKPITYLDLTLRMDELKFLDNDAGPDVPFYGGVAGTGVVQLKGSNTSMNLVSTEPIQVVEGSNFSLPLLEETELNTNDSFIQFVDSFENPKLIQTDLQKGINQNKLDEGALKEAIGNLAFSERFNIDLQFDAPNPITVRLVFDPITGEVLKAVGTGHLRIAMQAGDVQMFGQYAVQGGSYQFVAGEIFMRKLDIRPGGTILWEGPPDNARLNIEAVYQARPSMASLNAGGIDNTDPGGSQRVPVNLIVRVSGTVGSVENEYFFEMPNQFELASSSTLQYRLNQFNQDEQQKLLQATSILLTGNFIAGTTSQATNALGERLTQGSTFINPLLSNQIISPLLSNQINALLNSDVTQLDIDFRLNAYNQIDLGIALRLYNDKLILRREGVLTGGRAESSFGERIGDLNATYRITPNLSLTAFHRQGLRLGTIASNDQTGNLTPTVDGLGMEAQVQYNTWEGLWHKVKGVFNWLFGRGEKKQKEKTKK